MNKTKQILIIGLSVLTLLTALRFITKHEQAEPSYTFVVENGFTNDLDAPGVKKPYQPGGTFEYAPPEDKGVTMEPDKVIRYDLRGTNEMSLIDKMNMTLLELGLEKDQMTVKRLVAARAAYDWSKMPDSWKAAPDVVAWQAVKLKAKIARALDTTNELTIQRVLETDLGGITVPPMADFAVREGADAVYREAEAIKEAAK